MIKIKVDDNIKSEIHKKHYTDVKDRFKDTCEKIMHIPKYTKLNNYLYDENDEIIGSKLKKLLIGSKNDLVEIIDEIGQISMEKNDPFENLYTKFTNRNWSKSLLNKLNVRVCPYCNRQYTFTLGSDGIRPQFDHYFPKSLFPYLAVSLYNVIPSCSICNSKKSNLDTSNNTKDLYYPYEDEFGLNVVFQTSSNTNEFLYWTGISNDFDIKLICKDEKQNRKVENLKKHLKIELLYKEHRDYVRDIIRNAVIYNDSRVDELLEQFPDLFQSKEEVLNSIFMNYTEKDSWGNRPLSKLTYDIYEEFKIFSSK
ncbi:Uncharacterised protein [Priestia megaterium]|uniref:HNH nuclease n=1 Tax=Priestia megaterium TaxID=1404 RepID=UPI000E13D5E9|nr:HNH nuclease [Priestia megaterium]SUV06344.1 Uncharacterised protein [Priestia megaterium]